ncbi:phage tail spike protein [Gracilibacillus salinarum]|uniref:Tail spike domain-containing protein n=1 Tax=Gracilibacillus salinarum TaxID=2932255 RepID=A0ABY4GNB8_9BACI|nr:phage tail spike protein [Gracilibacillus salinarum]UOQ85698.1 hypothetical protein MUN87_01975 [Gracilibacillus salinarum]
MSQLFISDGSNNQALGHIRYRNVISNSHKKSLEDGSETFDFSTHADHSYSEFITGNNRVIIPSEDGDFLEFIIYEVQENRINRQLEIYSYASYAELTTAKTIAPHVTPALSAEAHGKNALADTGWQMGNVVFNGTRTLTFDEDTNPYKYLKRIASVFGLELRFRIEHEDGKITARYIDMVEKVGQWRGRRVEFGRDLIGLKRIENTENIVTALNVIGPEAEDGSRLAVFVEDKEALQRWGRNGRHITKDYKPSFSLDENVTEARLRKLGENELAKRINASVSYEGTIADLENVPGLENKKIRFGDTIQIKDTSYQPILYLEARIFFQDRDIKDHAQKQVRLGDYTEYTEEEVNAIWKSLQQQIKNKIAMSDLEEVTYTKTQIDTKDDTVESNAAADASQKAEQAQTNAEEHADNVASDAETNANSYTDQIKQAVDQELLDKADVTYVDGQLAFKAESSTVQTINDTVSNLQTAVNDNEDALLAQEGRIVIVENDIDEVEGELSIVITDLSTLDGTVQQQQTDISANSSAIALKAGQSALEDIEGDVTSVSNQVSTLQVNVNGISADVSSVQSTVDGHTTDISDLTTQVDIQAGQISSKVDATFVEGAINEKVDETINPIDARLEMAESDITQIAGEVNTKAEASTVTNLETRTTTAEQSISALEGSITTKVEESTFDSLENRVDTAESTISQHSNQIALKVNEDGVIAAINLSSETARILAANIELQGAVTVLSDIADSLGTITAGTINGVDINGSSFNSILDSNNYTTIENNHIHSEGIYYSDWAHANQKGVFDVNDGLITMQSGNTSFSTYGQAQISQFGLAIEHYNNNTFSGGAYIGPSAIGFGDWYDGASTARIYAEGNDLVFDANGSVRFYAGIRLGNDSGNGQPGSIYYNSGTGRIRVNQDGFWGNLSDFHRWDANGNSEGYFEGGAFHGSYPGLNTSGSYYIAYKSNNVWYKLRAGAADSVGSPSLESIKENIADMPFDSLDKIVNSKAYQWQYNNGIENGYDGYRYGLVIGRETPVEVLDHTGTRTDHLSMIALSWDAIKQLYGISTEIENDVNILQMKVQVLEQKVKQLEGVA